MCGRVCARASRTNPQDRVTASVGRVTATPVTNSGTAPVNLRTVAAIGLAAGALGGLFGVGGGFIIVPGLIAFTQMDRRLAHGTSLAATLPIGLASFLTYLAHGNIDWAVAAVLTAGSVSGAVLGTRLLRVIPKRPLTLIFVTVILATALRLVMGSSDVTRTALTVPSVGGLVLLGVAAGTLAGLLGIGGGVVMVPAMVVLFGIVPPTAKGTSAAVIVPTALMGTWRNRRHGNADLRAASVCGVAGMISAVIGGIVAVRLDDQVSNVTFGLLLTVVAISQLVTLRHGDDAIDDVTDDTAEDTAEDASDDASGGDV
jgi:uncharacterized protein